MPEIFILLFALMVVFFLMVMWLQRRRKTAVTVVEARNMEEEAYNAITITRNLAYRMRERGYNVESEMVVIERAQREFEARNYTAAYTLAMNARRALRNLAREPVVEDRTSPQVERELEFFRKIAESGTPPKPSEEEEEEYLSPTYLLQKKLPENYLQSRFEIRVAESKVAAMSHGPRRDAAQRYLDRAKSAFDGGNYTEALKMAVRSVKIADGEIEPEEEARPSPPPAPPEATAMETPVEGEEELRCPECNAVVRDEDKFCWNCGCKLEFVYICPDCGEEVSEGDRFCRHCGAKLV